MTRKIIAALVWACAGLGTLAAAEWAHAAGNFPWLTQQGPAERKEFLDASEVLQWDAPRLDRDRLELPTRIAEGYYVYRQSLRLEDSAGKAVQAGFPEGTAHRDDFFGETRIFQHGELNIQLPAHVPGPLTLHWQGCAAAGICYPPQTMQIALNGQSSAGSVPQKVDEPPLAEDQAAAARLASLGPVSGTLLFFGFGLLLAFTPCTLPMVPIVSAMVVGSQVRPRRALVLSLSYVLAMAITYAAVGVAAGLAGANLQAALQSPWLLGAFAGLFLVLGASLFGMFELRLPASLMSRLDAAGQGRTGGSVAGAAGMGFLSALLVGPCMTAPLAGALLYIGQSGSAVMGGAALFALGLGMGLPLLAIAMFGARVLPRPGMWMDRVRVAFGYVMVAMAVYMLSRFLPGAVSLILWSLLGLGLAVGLLGWLHTVTLQRRFGWTLVFGAAFAGMWSVIMMAGAASGGTSALRPLEHLRQQAGTVLPSAMAANRPGYVSAKTTAEVDTRIAEAGARGQWTLIDFYADWCVSCHVIERDVFGNEAVAARLSQFQVLRPDVTRNDADDKALMKRWAVLGPPTLILVGPDGREVRAQRMVGELDARNFMARLDAAGAP